MPIKETAEEEHPTKAGAKAVSRRGCDRTLPDPEGGEGSSHLSFKALSRRTPRSTCTTGGFSLGVAASGSSIES